MRAARICILSSILALSSRSDSERPSRHDNTRFLVSWTILTSGWKDTCFGGFDLLAGGALGVLSEPSLAPLTRMVGFP